MTLKLKFDNVDEAKRAVKELEEVVDDSYKKSKTPAKYYNNLLKQIKRQIRP